jgi:TonB-dependent SusC/RagA subfamily outer membrane receptor
MARPSLLLAASVLLAACGSTSNPEGRSVSAASAEAGDRAASPTGPVEAELRRFPGVTVTETADGVEVRVRGESSFLGGQEPLYVVDGTPMSPGVGGALVGVRRADIVDIRVLKSAAEVSSYGPRGANGVVVVTTTNGRR